MRKLVVALCRIAMIPFALIILAGQGGIFVLDFLAALAEKKIKVEDNTITIEQDFKIG